MWQIRTRMNFLRHTWVSCPPYPCTWCYSRHWLCFTVLFFLVELIANHGLRKVKQPSRSVWQCPEQSSHTFNELEWWWLIKLLNFNVSKIHQQVVPTCFAVWDLRAPGANSYCLRMTLPTRGPYRGDRSSNRALPQRREMRTRNSGTQRCSSYKLQRRSLRTTYGRQINSEWMK